MAVDSSAETLKGKMAERAFRKPANLNSEVSRRQFLKMAATAVGAAGVVAAEEATFGAVRKVTDRILGQGHEIKTKPTVFESLRSSISAASGSEELRAKLLGRVAEYERADNTLNAIRAANESHVEADGTPTLIAQTRARLFGKADISAFWQGKFASEREFIEDQVDILKPLRYQKILIGDFLQELATNPSKDDLNSYSELQDSGNHRRSDLPKVAFLPPGSRQAVTQPEFDQAFSLIKDIGTETPKKGQIEIKPPGAISPALQNLFEQDRQKVLSRIENLPFPEDITVVISSNRYGIPLDSSREINWQEAEGTLYRDDNGKMVLNLRIELDDYSAVVHETGHYFIMDYVNSFIKASEIVPYKIAIEKVLSDPKIGRNYPDIGLLFNDVRQNAGRTNDLDVRFGTVSPELFRYSTGTYPDGVWIRQARQGPLTGDKGIFGDILPYRMVESFSKQTPIPFEGFNFSEFVKAEKVHLDQLSASDPVWAYVVSEIRKKPQQFDYSSWASSLGDRIGAEIGTLPSFYPKQGIDYPSYWKGVVTFGQAILADGFKKGEPVVVQALSRLNDQAKKNFLDLWKYNLMGQCDAEKFAETFNLAISHPELVPEGVRSFADFKNIIQNNVRPNLGQILPNQK